MVNSHGEFIWYGLMTTDMEDAKSFYAKLLGWTTQDASSPDTAFELFVAGKNPVAGLMGLPEDARRMGAAPTWIGYVGVDDVDASSEEVERLGGIIHVPPTDVADISRFSLVGDPQNATLALFKWRNADQRLPPEPDKPGHVCWHELLAADWEKAFAFYQAVFGWQKAGGDTDEMGTYQTFSAGGRVIGGMFTQPAMLLSPFWLYYFNVSDIDTAVKSVAAAGGRVLEGPIEVRTGGCVARCADPQGAMFALQAPRRHTAPGYFERAANDPSARGGRRWSW